MSLFVGIYNIKDSQKNLAGIISLDKDGIKVKSFDKTNILKNIIKKPIFNLRTEKFISCVSSPEEWMYSLQYHYRSPYLWASSPSLSEPLPTFREPEGKIPDLANPANKNSGSGENPDEQKNPQESPTNDSGAEEGGSTVPRPQNAPQPV